MWPLISAFHQILAPLLLHLTPSKGRISVKAQEAVQPAVDTQQGKVSFLGCVLHEKYHLIGKADLPREIASTDHHMR